MYTSHLKLLKYCQSLLLVLMLIPFASYSQSGNTRARTLIVVFDGLRPDYITAENMPNVYALKQSGAYVPRNHSVFPTVTRVNASSYATGSYPGTHGLLGNSVYFPKVDSNKALNTGEAEDLMKIARSTDNKLLTTTSLGEVLASAGEKLMVFSSGSSGQAFLQNHTLGRGGVVHPELILPESLKKEVLEKVGPPPASGKPNVGQHDWATRAFLHFAGAKDAPLVSAIWFSDPDGAAHSYGIGSAQAMESIKAVDEQFGFIVHTLESRGLLKEYNIIVTADHGFATQVGKKSVGQFLIEQGFKESKDSDDVVLAGNAIYVKGSDESKIRKIVAALQEQPWVGGIFTRPSTRDHMKGWIDGTLSFEAVHWNHDRAADILVDYNWSDEANAQGYKGTSYATGVAGHGGASPYEITIPLIASGPAFKNKFESSLPASNVDIVPTILHILGLQSPKTMDGRVLRELLAKTSKKDQPAAKTERLEASTRTSSGSYRVLLQRTIVDHQQYVDFVRTERK